MSIRNFATALAAWTVLTLSMVSIVFSAELISATEAHELAAKGELILIDVRRPGEWKSTGVGASAHAISMHENGFLNKLSMLVDGNKQAKIAIICAAGNRSTWISSQLESRGYANVSNVKEGMLGSASGAGWLAMNLPVKKPSR